MTETNPVKVLSDDEVSEIEARANAATEGPWTEYHRISPRGAHKQWHVGNKDGLCQITMHGHQRDYEFMAHAREDIPALCATVRALSASLSKANEVVEEAVHTNTALREQLAEARKQRDGWERARRDDEYTFERIANSIGMSWCCMAETIELESRIQQMVAKCSDLQSRLAQATQERDDAQRDLELARQSLLKMTDAVRNDYESPQR